MSEKTKQNNPAEVTKDEPEKKPEKKKDGKPMKKDGIFTRAKNWCKRNKNALIAGGVGVGVGVAGTIGVSELGKRRAEKKVRNAYLPQEEAYSTLDPNV